MAAMMSLAGALDPAPAPIGSTAAAPSVPTTKFVSSLEAALREVRRVGGAVTSETRTAPGIGSWAFVADGDGTELVLWEDATAAGR